MDKSIGQILKKVRKEAGLTQKEMCEDILSISAYSKLERGVHEIDIETLYLLLGKNSALISVKNFLQELLINLAEEKDADLYLQVNLAFIANDLKSLEQISRTLKDSTNDKLLVTLKLAILSLQENPIIDDDLKANINKKIITLRRIENWTIVSLSQLNLLLPFIKIDECKYFLKKAWRNYQASKKTSIIFLETYVRTLLKYLEILLKKNIPKDFFDEPLKLIDKIIYSTEFDSIIGLGMKAKKIEAIVNKNSDLYAEIVQAEKLIGITPQNESELVWDNIYN